MIIKRKEFQNMWVQNYFLKLIMKILNCCERRIYASFLCIYFRTMQIFRWIEHISATKKSLISWLPWLADLSYYNFL